MKRWTSIVAAVAIACSLLTTPVAARAGRTARAPIAAALAAGARAVPIRPNPGLQERGSFVARAGGRLTPGPAATALPRVGGGWAALGPKPIVPPAFVQAYTYGKVSGRVTAFAVDPATPTTVYLGSAGGGVWKSVDSGANWTPLTDAQVSDGIGAIAIDPTNSQVIYAATGEDNGCDDICPPSHGILKSSDGGASWVTLGQSTFDQSAAGNFYFIGSIVVDRTNHLHLVVATNFGLFSSPDGGATWTRNGQLQTVATAIATFSASGGVNQVLQDTDVATKWWAAASDSCATEVGDVLVSNDGGGNWSVSRTFSDITGGAERIALGLGPGSGTGSTGYASVSGCTSPTASGENGPYRVTTAANVTTWSTVPAPVDVLNPYGGGGQGFYDNVVGVDPANSAHVLIGGVTIIASSDGGSTWADVGLVFPPTPPYTGPIHSDFHAIAFTPTGGVAYIGSDGGAWKTSDLGGTAQVSDYTNLNDTLQLTQYYAGFSKDLATLAGGSQDNGTTGYYGAGPAPPAMGQINGGDGAWAQFASGTSYYTSAQSGDMAIVDTSQLGTSAANLTENGPCKDPSFNLTGPACGDGSAFIAPFVASPTQTSRLYNGTYRIWRSTNSGLAIANVSSWSPISGDLTLSASDFLAQMAIRSIGGHDIVVAASHFGAVSISFNAEAPSPTWTTITGNLPARTPLNRIPNNVWVPQITINPSNPDEVWIALGTLVLGRVWHTANANAGAGTVWTDIGGTGGGQLPLAITKSVAIDPAHPTTVIAGTDSGAYVCFSCGGANPSPSWAPLGTGLPNSRVQFLTVTDDGLNLVAWTHGRGAWTIPMPISLNFQVATSTSTPTAGAPFTATLTTRFADGGTDAAYTGTVHLTSSDGQAVLPADYAFQPADSGVHAFSGGVTLKTAGLQAVTATDTVVAAITGSSGPLTVGPATANSLTVAAPSSAVVATPFSFTVTARDQYGNTATGYPGTVHLASSDAGATLPADSRLSSGVGNFNATLGTLGSQTISATDAVNAAITGISGGINVTPTPVDHFVFGGLPAVAGKDQGFSFSLTAKDVAGNTITGYLGTVHLTSSGSAVLPADYTFSSGENGVHTGFEASLGTIGSGMTITATDLGASPGTTTSSGIQVDNAYYFTWYDHASDINFVTGTDEIHAVNIGASTAHLQIHIPGIPACDIVDTLGAGLHRQWSCGTGFGGPVVILSDQPLDTSQRVKYASSFNEAKAQAGTSASNSLVFTWFDKVSDPAFLAGQDDVHIFNPGAGVASVTVHIPGFPACDFSSAQVPPATDQTFECATGFGGPVTVASSRPVLGSQRVKYNSSFNEVPAAATAPGARNLVYTWFDRISDVGFTSDDIHVYNPGLVDALVTVHIPGSPGCDYAGQPVLSGHDAFFGCPSGFGGPVTVRSDQPVIGSQRVKYYASFNEVAAVGSGSGNVTQTFPFFDTLSAGVNGDNIHVVNPGGSLATVQVAIAGCPVQPDTIGAGDEKYFSCAGGSGGPVTVTSDLPVLASQRVKFFQSFNEVAAF